MSWASVGVGMGKIIVSIVWAVWTAVDGMFVEWASSSMPIWCVVC